jgi:hypothetical protein
MMVSSLGLPVQTLERKQNKTHHPKWTTVVLWWKTVTLVFIIL